MSLQTCMIAFFCKLVHYISNTTTCRLECGCCCAKWLAKCSTAVLSNTITPQDKKYQRATQEHIKGRTTGCFVILAFYVMRGQSLLIKFTWDKRINWSESNVWI